MKKTTIRLLVLVAVFLIATGVFSVLTNKVNEDLTTTMSEASLPIIHFYSGDTQINELHGYVEEMDPLSMRDSIIPIDSTRQLTFDVATYGEGIDGISYQIRSMDNERLVAEDQLNDYKVEGNKIQMDISIPNALEENEEYMLVFNLSSGSRSINYYARIMQTSNCYVKECLAFAQEFHDKTFADNSKNYFPTYMDATTGETDTLSYVDLSCTLSQLRWGDFKGKPMLDPVIDFKEINESYNVITINTVVNDVNENGEQEFFNVEEYFRLRFSETRMYVLNYERTVQQLFKGENDFVTEKSNLLLGIRDEDVEYMASESGSIVCFVQAGDLWSFNKSTSEIMKVFSFRSIEGVDKRENWDQHDIKIVRIDEAGSIDFIVYGYMNRGEHEGSVGTAVYHYDGLAHTLEEEAYIPANTSYEMLKAEMGHLMYENDRGIFYFMLEGNVYTINMETLKVSVMISNLEEDCYAVSENNKYFAWIETENQYSCTSLHIMNLQTGDVQDITEGSGKYLKPLGFIDQDFIYGIADSEDVRTDAAGNTTFAMKYIKIMDTSEDKYEVLKEYSPQSGCVESIQVEDFTITVNLIRLAGNQYYSAGTDAIMNHDADVESAITVAAEYSDTKAKETVLTMNASTKTTKYKLITSKNLIVGEDRIVKIEGDSAPERFYVYVKGNVILATDSISTAISCANKNMGVVIDSSQQYVWERARKTYAQAFSNIAPNEADANSNSVAKCVSAMLMRKEITVAVSELLQSGVTVKQILEQKLTDSVVLDVSGCTVEDIFFYVSNGSPVFAMIGNDSAVLVTGYSTTHVYYYNPLTGKTESSRFEDADEMFLNGGNRFFTYIDR